MSSDPIARWHAMLEARTFDQLPGMLADEVVFQSPAVHRPQEGPALTIKYLNAAFAVLNNDAFRYVGEWRAERSAVLEFETRLGEVEINGVDIIHWNAEGLITRFKVMVRPMKALNTVIPLMAAQLGPPAA